jgi:hypothetical protein
MQTTHSRRRAPYEYVPLAVTIIAGLVCYGLFYRRGIWLSVVAYSVAPAERVMQGEIPYRDFLFNYTPGILWLNALLMKVFGLSLMTVNWGLYVFKVAALAALYLVGRRVIGTWPALIPAALTLAWLGHRYIFNVHPTQYYMVFALAGLGFMLRCLSTGSRVQLLLCGLSIGLVFLFKHNVGLLLLGAATGNTVLAALVSGAEAGRSHPASSVRGVALLWAGFGVVAVAFVIWLSSHGALGPMIDHFAHHAAEYSDERAIGLPPLRWLLPVLVAIATAATAGWFVARRAPKLLEAYLCLIIVAGAAALLMPVRAATFKQSATTAVAYVPPFVFAAGLALLAWDWKTSSEPARGASWWKRNAALVTVSVFALAVYLEVYPRADYYHLVRVLPPVFLVLVMVLFRAVSECARLSEGMSHRSRLLLGTAPLVMLALVGLKDTWRPQFDDQFRFVDRVPAAIPRAEGLLVSERDAVVIQELSRIITDNSIIGDPVFSFARRGGAYYFLAERRNPTRLLWWDSAGIRDEDRVAVVDLLRERRVKLVIIQQALDDAGIREELDRNYELAGSSGDLEVAKARAW